MAFHKIIKLFSCEGGGNSAIADLYSKGRSPGMARDLANFSRHLDRY